MGIIGDAFGSLFGVIWDALKWLGNFIKSLFQGLIDIIVNFFKVIYDLIDGLLYFLYKVGILALKFFELLLDTGKLLWSLVVGFGRTLASLSYSPRGSSGSGYSEMLGKLFNSLSGLQLDVVAYILLFSIWITTAVAAIKLLSSIRVGGD